jgi:hypothetical protein
MSRAQLLHWPQRNEKGVSKNINVMRQKMKLWMLAAILVEIVLVIIWMYIKSPYLCFLTLAYPYGFG